eukprot:6557016-Ditylum_brightwellii.AAC.1
MKVRCAGPQPSETSSEDVHLSMKSDKEESSSDSNLSENKKKKIGNACKKKKVNANKVIWTNKSITKDEKAHIFTQSTILDSGTRP